MITVYDWLYWDWYHLRMLNLTKSRSFYLEFYILFSASIQTWQLKILSLQQKFGPFFSLPVMQVYHVWLRNQRLDLKGYCGFHSFNNRMHDNCHYKVQLPILPVLKLGIVFYYKVRRLLYKTVRQWVLHSATGITKCGRTFHKRNDLF